jgi:hypothetical protein
MQVETTTILLTWMSHGASEVHKSALSQQDNISAIFHREAIDLGIKWVLIEPVRRREAKLTNFYLWFDVDFLGSIRFKPLHVNLAIKVANVAHNCVILHPK